MPFEVARKSAHTLLPRYKRVFATQKITSIAEKVKNPSAKKLADKLEVS